MKTVVTDGQDGKTKKSMVKQLKRRFPDLETYAIGTNSITISAILRAGATYGAMGENLAIVNSRDANTIIGPIGIVMVNSLLGEVIPAMVAVIGSSNAHRILIPVNRCNHYVVDCRDSTLFDYVNMAYDEVGKEVDSK